jgi:hypothetical protein
VGVGIDADESGAVHCAAVPPLFAEQRHVQLPVAAPPLTREALPVAHKLLLGLLVVATPFAVPQAPLTACSGAVHETELPLSLPAQRHDHVPFRTLFRTRVAVPDVQRSPAAGCVAVSTPAAAPHCGSLAVEFPCS